jgi:hypothetical protein
MTIAEYALEPLKAAVTRLAPEIEESVKARQTIVIDFDSYRRRLKALEQKKELSEKEKWPDAKLAELAQEIQKFETKRASSEAEYNTQNAKTKADILSAKLAHDHLMDLLLICVVTAQVETKRVGSFVFKHRALTILSYICSQIFRRKCFPRLQRD